jgi:hypothetical protein
MKNELIEMQAKLLPRENHPVSLECQMLRLLLNQTMTCIQFPPGLDLENQHVVSELWQSFLAERPPDMHTIVSRGNWNQKPFINGILLKFPNLEVLRLEQFECKDADLIIIADHLPKLR